MPRKPIPEELRRPAGRPAKTVNTTQTSIHLPTAIYEALVNAAEQRGVAISAVATEAIEAYIAKLQRQKSTE